MAGPDVLTARAVDRWIGAAAALGFTAVLLGAFGAHGLRSMLVDAPDAAERLGWWETGVTATPGVLLS